MVDRLEHSSVDAAIKVLYQWNYDAKLEKLRDLYAKANEAQWIAERNLNWDQPIDINKWTAPLGSAMPVEKTTYWRSLSIDVVNELTRRMAGFRLSQILHGEQAALMVAGQLVSITPHMDAKFYAATQTMDEARHVDVFSRYVAKVDGFHPIVPALRQILDATLSTSDWLKKLIGMQIIIEGLALSTFREMRNLTEEPLLKELLLYVSRDESRHHAFGVHYIAGCVAVESDEIREELEDFAFEASKAFISQMQQSTFLTMVQLWSECGISPVELFASLKRERDRIGGINPRERNFGPFREFIIPSLKRCGLLSERLSKRLGDFLQDTVWQGSTETSVEEVLSRAPELTEETADWLAAEFDDPVAIARKANRKL